MQDRAGTDLRLRPSVRDEDAEGMVAQVGLVTLPYRHHSLVDAGEGVALVVYRNQALEPLELFVESVSIEFDQSQSLHLIAGCLPGSFCGIRL